MSFAVTFCFFSVVLLLVVFVLTPSYSRLLCVIYPLIMDVQITVSATGVLRLLDHVCGTRCQSIYGSATVSDSLNGVEDPSVQCLGSRRFVTP